MVSVPVVSEQKTMRTVPMVFLIDIRNIPEQQVDELLKRLDLYGLKERHPNTISGGQKQRLSVAVGLLSNREVILFDEPTSGLDAGNMRRVADIVKELKKQEKYVILVSHDHEFMNLCCDRICEPFG